MDDISVLIVDQSIAHSGILTNLGLVIGLTAGRLLPDQTFGPDLIDGDGREHRYLTSVVHVVRKAGQNKLRDLRAYFEGQPGVILVDYTDDAAVSSYDDYTHSLTGHSGEAIKYRALYLYGPRDLLYPKTKNLSALS